MTGDAGTDRGTGRDADEVAGNEAGALRTEDAFDVAAVAAWLDAAGLGPDFARGRLPRVRQFAGGASNLTYLLSYPGGELILRRAPVGAKAKGAHDMGREFRVQQAVSAVSSLVPTMIGHCADEAVIGSEFYLMSRIEGAILRRDLPSSYTAEQADRLCRNALDVLIDLHAVDVAAVPELAALGKGPGYVERQVSGWTHRLGRAATDDLGDWSDITGWLDRVRPEDVGQCLIHNDFRFDNLVLAPDDPTRIVGVLDWEMATVGDPLMELGATLAYWVQADDDAFMQSFRRQPTNAPGMWTRDQVVSSYASRTGLRVDADGWRFYEVFGLFRLAVIAQQISYRYVLGQTTNPAHGAFAPAVAQLERRCRSLIREVD